MTMSGFIGEMQTRLARSPRDRIARCGGCGSWLEGEDDVIEIPDDPAADVTHQTPTGACGPVVILTKAAYRCAGCGRDVAARDLIDDGAGNKSHRCGPVIAVPTGQVAAEG